MGKVVKINFKEKFSADVRETWADTSYLDSLIGFTPQTNLQTGIGKFADWFNSEIVREKLPSWNI
jgi:UDP-glucuronate 4-epimerase